jgi:hypothetical protein
MLDLMTRIIMGMILIATGRGQLLTECEQFEKKGGRGYVPLFSAAGAFPR